MATCPNGHASADEEYCDVCGLAMSGSPSVAAPSISDRPATPTAAPAGPVGGPCPVCGAPLDGRFCEACGHDSLAAPPVTSETAAETSPDAAPVSWIATVSADRAYYNTVMAIGGPDASAIEFPPFCPDRYFPLRGKQISIGRRSSSRGINPDIDLTGPPEDPGVSHLHAMLLVQPDGSLSIVDLGSANGTSVNDSPLRANTPHPLSARDRVHLGAWTTITLQADR